MKTIYSGFLDATVYALVGTSQQKAALSAARWFVIAHAIGLAPSRASIAYTGCIGGWRDLVSVTARPDNCAVDACFEITARTFPDRINCEVCDVASEMSSGGPIRGNDLDEAIQDVVFQTLKKNVNLVSDIAKRLIVQGEVTLKEIFNDFGLLPHIDTDALIKVLRRRDE